MPVSLGLWLATSCQPLGVCGAQLVGGGTVEVIWTPADGEAWSSQQDAPLGTLYRNVGGGPSILEARWTALGLDVCGIRDPDVVVQLRWTRDEAGDVEEAWTGVVGLLDGERLLARSPEDAELSVAGDASGRWEVTGRVPTACGDFAVPTRIEVRWDLDPDTVQEQVQLTREVCDPRWAFGGPDVRKMGGVGSAYFPDAFLPPVDGRFVNRRITAHVWSPTTAQIAMVRCPKGEVEDCALVVADDELAWERQLVSHRVPRGGLAGWVGPWIYFVRGGEVYRTTFDDAAPERMTFTDRSVRWAFPLPSGYGIYLLAEDEAGQPQAYWQWHPEYGPVDTLLQVSPGDPPAQVLGPTYGGERLLYATGPQPGSPHQLWAGDLRGGPPQMLASATPGLEFALSPDGEWVVLTDPFGGTLRRTHVDGRARRDLAPEQGASDLLWSFPFGEERYGTAPQPRSWSPDSEYVVFGSDRTGQFHIYRAHRDGGKIELLTDGWTMDWSPSISPDGTRLAFLTAPYEGFSPADWAEVSELRVVPYPSFYQAPDP